MILTSDITSPIRRSVEELDEIIKQIEEEAVKEKILSKVPEAIKQDIIYFTQNEFVNRYKKANEVIYLTKGEDILQKYNQDSNCSIFGEFLKYCDQLSAFLEARISISHGISSKELEEGARNLEYLYNAKNLNGIDLGYLFRDFK